MEKKMEKELLIELQRKKERKRRSKIRVASWLNQATAMVSAKPK